MTKRSIQDVQANFAAFQDWLVQAGRSMGAEITSPWFYTQLGLIIAAAGFAMAGAAALRAKVDLGDLGAAWPLPLRRLLRVLVHSFAVLIFGGLTFVMRLVMLATTWPSRSYLLITAASLAFAWLVIRLVTSAIRNEFAVRLISVLAWAIAALSILGLLDPAVGALDSVAVVLGGLRLTPLLILKAAVFLAVALWIAGVIGSFAERRIASSRDLTPSLQVLLAKVTRVVLIVVAVVVVMAAVGIDLSSLAIFSSAIGVGIGFGLQKIVSNFVSGIILLTDKSVKPGDLITAGDSFGRVAAMNTRYILVAAGDGREFLIPNEDLVTQKVVNWTYADSNTMVKVNFATTYDADPRQVCRLAVEVAAAAPRVLKLKPPVCLITEFAESGMKFTVTFWIADPEAGMDNARSDVMLALWETFRREGIEVPYPVRDLRLRGPLAVEVAATNAAG
ncbi:mechanosensitive ion channel family protein [Bradyrhizobium sp. WD16]|uniref:mechanosensitive ion channel family protein n=1 Tax=Bradyrhizobium sp. WD16 TaxID=1521768 RepID=UPI0021FE9D0E|nr:mechanosensitive ion channel protein MscS [Bradyrhizobium sp. WD16]